MGKKAPSYTVEGDPEYDIYIHGMKDGIDQGKTEAQVEILNFLQNEYMQGEVERGSIQGNLILDMARKVSEHMKAWHKSSAK